ncbi:MAG TPA: GGDEF domain-containing protein [Myxococcota bacterium]|nr:GGDEF domain-containing protein [Myxococcota bacterium]HQK51941.1 GGDEF domain-containing protein [Myxococcota bacterium]
MGEDGDPGGTGRSLLAAIRKALGLSTLTWWEEAGVGRWRLVAREGEARPGDPAEGEVTEDLGVAAAAMTQKRALRLDPNPPRALRVPGNPRAVPLAGAAAIPIEGGLFWADRREASLSDRDLEALVDGALGLAGLRGLTRDLAESRRVAEGLGQTVEGARALLAAHSEETCLRLLAEAAARLTGASLALVCTVGPSDEEGIVRAQIGAEALSGVRFPLDRGLVGVALRSGTVVPTSLTRSGSRDREVLGGDRDLDLDPGDALMVMPIGSPESLGALVLARGVFRWGASMHGIRTLCDVAALLVRQFRLRDQVALDALRDGLTGLYNRKALMSLLSEWTAFAVRHRVPLALLMIDADHFKAVNDRHGHPVGDRVLRMIADTVRATLRESDLAGRYGGEEFAVVLPHTDLEGARQVAERIRRGCEGVHLPLPTGPLAVTVSIGVTTLKPGMRRPEDLVGQADEALYRAKAEGRNRVVCRR